MCVFKVTPRPDGCLIVYPNDLPVNEYVGEWLRLEHLDEVAVVIDPCDKESRRILGTTIEKLNQLLQTLNANVRLDYAESHLEWADRTIDKDMPVIAVRFVGQ